MQNMVQIGIRGWAGRIPSLPLFLVLPFVFLYSSHRVLATPLDRFRHAMAHVFSAKEVPFGGPDDEK